MCEEKLVEEEGAGKGGRGKEVVEGEGDGRTRRNEGGRVRSSWSEWRRKEGEEGGGRVREGGVGGGGRGRKGGGERQGGGVETEPPGQIPVELLLYFCIF